METATLHKKNSAIACKCSVFTISTSRYEKYGSVDRPERAEDVSGKFIWGILKSQGHEVVDYRLMPDNLEAIRSAVKSALYSQSDIIITTGGTGISKNDVTFEAVTPLFEKEMPGFGELFRQKSIEHIGSAVILTRATAGVAKDKIIFCLPGSPQAVKLAMEIIAPEIGHLVKHVRE